MFLRVAVACSAFAAFALFVSAKHNCSSVWKAGHYLNISSIHYVREESARVSHYDERSCFIMDARYNCKHPTPRKNTLLNWKLHLRDNLGQTCSVSEMWNHTGGLPQLAKNIRSWSHRRVNVTHTNVLILGSSFLRQVYESLVCRYRELIVDGLVQVNGSHIGMAEMARKNGTYHASDMGTMYPMSQYREGCHADRASHYYDPTVVPPVLNQECADSISMVEFPEGLRFYYVFRPTVYSTCIPDLFMHMKLEGLHVDAVVTNYVPPEIAALRRYLDPQVAVIDAVFILESFRAVQTRDCGWWDGADNIGIDHVPDIHPCMPGVPDDELEVLLFALAHKLQRIVMPRLCDYPRAKLCA